MYYQLKLFLVFSVALFVFSGCSPKNSISSLPKDIPQVLVSLETKQTDISVEVQEAEISLEEEPKTIPESVNEQVSLQSLNPNKIKEEKSNIKLSIDPISNNQTTNNSVIQKNENNNLQERDEPKLIASAENNSPSLEEKQIPQTENVVEKTKETILKADVLYKDGIYTNSALGRDGPLEVQVEIIAGKILKIEVLSHQDTKNLASNVFRLMTKEVLSKQNPEVDIISGATLTSNGYKEAIKNALSTALIK